ncbi:hypothetical protein [Pseudomonas sp.]|uniref:hypothetical protein n=1 Tax=Pseudomonas sp. TaxID=306 RepID=UPI00258FA95F|nr:hypothetical protein [Pseudomonas sp.]
MNSDVSRATAEAELKKALTSNSHLRNLLVEYVENRLDKAMREASTTDSIVGVRRAQGEAAAYKSILRAVKDDAQ